MQRKPISLRKWLIFIVAITAVVLLCAMLMITASVSTVMREQIFTSNESILQLYMEKLDDNLLNMEKFIINFPASNEDMTKLMMAKDEESRYFATIDIYNDLNKNALIYDTFDGIFVYSKDRKTENFIYVDGSRGDYTQQQDIKNYVLQNLHSTTSWKTYCVENRSYIIRIVKTGTTYCGAWAKAENLMKPFESIDLGENGFALMTQKDGHPLTKAERLSQTELLTTDNNVVVTLESIRFLQNCVQSKFVNISLVTLIPDSVVLSKANHIQAIILSIFLVMILSVIGIAYLFSKIAYRQLQELMIAMQTVGEGNLNVHINADKHFLEFATTSRQFNHMVGQIKQLKEDVYERELREQRTQLQYLQLQIRPHFFLNTLNVIYSFAQIERYDLIQKLTLCLVKYFRYMFNNATSFVSLQKEREHVENYMTIQELRYPGLCNFKQIVEEDILDTLIPPLVIQTFIENSIKYALDMEQERLITLKLQSCRINERRYLYILVVDNGCGYPIEVLEALKHEQSLSCDPTQNIGIINVIQRLRLLYGQDAVIKISNNPDGGANSEIFLPIQVSREV